MMVQLRFRVPFLKAPIWLYPNSLERFCLMWNENGSIELLFIVKTCWGEYFELFVDIPNWEKFLLYRHI